MNARLVRYRVKPERAAENEQSIAKVFEQLSREQPNGLRYAAFKLEDGVTFVHVAIDERLSGESTLASLSAFKEFGAGIPERCEEQPVVTKLTVVGSYASEPATE